MMNCGKSRANVVLRFFCLWLAVSLSAAYSTRRTKQLEFNNKTRDNRRQGQALSDQTDSGMKLVSTAVEQKKPSKILEAIFSGVSTDVEAVTSIKVNEESTGEYSTVYHDGTTVERADETSIDMVYDSSGTNASVNGSEEADATIGLMQNETQSGEGDEKDTPSIYHHPSKKREIIQHNFAQFDALVGNGEADETSEMKMSHMPQEIKSKMFTCDITHHLEKCKNVSLSDVKRKINDFISQNIGQLRKHVNALKGHYERHYGATPQTKETKLERKEDLNILLGASKNLVTTACYMNAMRSRANVFDPSHRSNLEKIMSDPNTIGNFQSIICDFKLLMEHTNQEMQSVIAITNNEYLSGTGLQLHLKRDYDYRVLTGLSEYLYELEFDLKNLDELHEITSSSSSL